MFDQGWEGWGDFCDDDIDDNVDDDDNNEDNIWQLSPRAKNGLSNCVFLFCFYSKFFFPP